MKPNQTVLYLISFFLVLALGMPACNDNDDNDDDDAYRTDAMIRDVWGAPSGEVFAVGSMKSRGVVFQLDETVWRPMVVPDIDFSLSTVWGLSATDVYAVGGYCSSLTEPTDCDSVIIHYDGQAWTKMEIPETLDLLDIWGASPSAIWAVGGVCQYVEGKEVCLSVILRYNGESWSEERLGEEEYPLSGIWGNSPENIYAVGCNRLLHYDGTFWSNVDIPDQQNYHDVWGAGTDLYLFGSSIWYFDGSSWERIVEPFEAGYLLAGWCQSPSDIYAAGYAYCSEQESRTKSHVVYLGTIAHFDGESLKVTTKRENPYLSGIWGRSSSDIFVCGSNGILHYDGAKWRPMEFGD